LSWKYFVGEADIFRRRTGMEMKNVGVRIAVAVADN
jgi:hypothetical protein